LRGIKKDLHSKKKAARYTITIPILLENEVKLLYSIFRKIYFGLKMLLKKERKKRYQIKMDKKFSITFTN
jgi:hypothetical protein